MSGVKPRRRACTRPSTCPGHIATHVTNNARPVGRQLARGRHFAVQDIGNAVTGGLAGTSGDEHGVYIAQDGVQGTKCGGPAVNQDDDNLCPGRQGSVSRSDACVAQARGSGVAQGGVNMWGATFFSG